MLNLKVIKIIPLFLLCNCLSLFAFQLPDQVEDVIQSILEISPHDWTFDNTIGSFAQLVVDLKEQYPQNAKGIYQKLSEREALMEVLTYSAVRITKASSFSSLEKKLAEDFLELSIHTFINQQLSDQSPYFSPTILKKESRLLIACSKTFMS